MQTLKKWSLVYAGALLSVLTVGCGNLSQLADAANQEAAAQDDQQAADDSSSSTSGGSLALSAPSTADAAVKKLHVIVQNVAACESNDGRDGPKEGHDRRPPPPPRRDDRDGRHDHRKGGMPPRDMQEGANLTEASSDDSTDDAAPTEEQAPYDDRKQSDCIVAESTVDFEAGAAIQLDDIPVGSYTVLVMLEDENGKAIEQGSAEVEIKIGEVAAAEITLAPVPEGSVSITIKEATPTTDDAAATEESTDESAAASADAP